MTVSIWGALIALILAIGLILRKVAPVYGMMIGALVGGLVGGLPLIETVSLMVSGAQGIIPAVLRILAAGVLAGVLIESGAAKVIATTIIEKLGNSRALLALIFATLLLTTVGVFIDIAVITVAPIALAIAHQSKISKTAILVAMVGGGKAGNIMSPNPNTIAAADAFNLELTSLMAAGILPAVVGVIVTFFIARRLTQKGSFVSAGELSVDEGHSLPPFLAALAGPLVAIFLLALRPLADIAIDPLIALPLGGLVGAILMGRVKEINHFASNGLARMVPVAIMLLGTGTLAGIIGKSELKEVMIHSLNALGASDFILAPIAGALMSFATASTTAGTAIASQTFGDVLLGLGLAPLAAAAMLHSGATVLDHMPHGSFFHATGGAVNMSIQERLKVIPYETLIGLSLAITSTLIFGVFHLF